MNCIHTNKYNITDSLASLLPDGGPVLCRDEMEEWSPSEANLFEEALEKYGKDFRDIQQDFVRAIFVSCDFVVMTTSAHVSQALSYFVLRPVDRIFISVFPSVTTSGIAGMLPHSRFSA